MIRYIKLLSPAVIGKLLTVVTGRQEPEILTTRLSKGKASYPVSGLWRSYKQSLQVGR